MRLGLSNLAYELPPTTEELRELASLGFSGIEVAPARIAAWDQLSDQRLDDFRRELGDCGFEIPSLQAIFFGVDGLSLLGERDAFERMASHIDRVGQIAARLGATVAVFGAPRQRAKGELGDQDAFSLGVERFARLAGIAFRHGMTIGLEPVPKAYGCDFLDSWQAVKAMVEAVSQPGLSIHLDTGCVSLGGGDIGEAIRACQSGIRHFHVAEPDLRGFDAPEAFHEPAAAALNSIGYPGWVVVEMLAAKAKGGDAVPAAARYVSRVYGGAQ